MELVIPANSPVVQVTGMLVTADSTAKGSNLCQILFSEQDMGIDSMKHVLNIWGPDNFEEASKLVGKPVQVAAQKSKGDHALYRVPKGTRIVPLKG